MPPPSCLPVTLPSWFRTGALFCLLLTACGSHDARVVTVDGVLHVHNPAEPLRPDLMVDLGEVLRIGREDAGEEYLLPGVGGLGVDRQGRIFVLGAGEDQVRVFAPDGTWQHTFGRRGQGPGELYFASSLSLDHEGNVWISNIGRNRLSIYSPQGEHLKDILFEGVPPMLVETTPEGFMGLFVSQRLSEDQRMIEMTLSLRTFSAEGDSLGTLFSTDLQMDRADMQLGGMADRTPYYTQDDQGRIWQVRGRTDAYEINVYGSDGRLDRVVSKAFRPIPKSEEAIRSERQMVQDALDQQLGGQALPAGMNFSYDPEPNRPATGLIYNDPRGLIWLQAGRHDSEDMNAFDLFDAEGRFLQRVVLEGVENPVFLNFHGDRLVFTDMGSGADPQVIVYRVTVTGW